MPLCPPSHTFGIPLLDDFRNFLQDVLWKLKGVKPTPLQFEIADWVWRGGKLNFKDIPDKRMAEALRGCGKSTITHIYNPWEVRRSFEYTNGHPDIHVMLVAGTKDLALDAAAFIRDLIEMHPLLQCMVPEDPNEKWSGSKMNVRGRVPAIAATIFARGLMGRMTGDRADIIAFDDIELPQNAETMGMRTKMKSRAQEFADVLLPGGYQIGLGTPQIEDTIYNDIEEWGFVRRKWPSEYPDERWMSKHGHLLSPRLAKHLVEDPTIVGTPTEPTRFPDEVLEQRRRVGRARYLLQNMLDTSMADEDRYPLKLRDLIVADLEDFKGPESPTWTNDPARARDDLPCCGLMGDGLFGMRDDGGTWVPYEYVVCGIDPSGRGKDETGYAIVGAIGGTAYLLRCVGLQGGFGPHVLSRIVSDCAHFRVNEIIPEDNFGGGMFSSLLGAEIEKKVREYRADPDNLKPWPGAGIEPVNHFVQSKENRIADCLEPVVQQHRLVVSAEVLRRDLAGDGEHGESYRFTHQFTRLQRMQAALTHDDRLEAVAIAIKRLTDRMRLRGDHAKDQRTAAEDALMWKEYWANNTEGGLKVLPKTGWTRSIATRNKRRSTMGRHGGEARPRGSSLFRPVRLGPSSSRRLPGKP